MQSCKLVISEREVVRAWQEPTDLMLLMFMQPTHDWQSYLNLEFMSCNSMPNELSSPDWNQTDKSHDEFCWLSSSNDPPEESLIHSDQWMYGYMGNAFAKCLSEVLMNCQSYPGDEEPLVSPFRRRKSMTISKASVLTYTCPGFVLNHSPLVSGMWSSVHVNYKTLTSGKQLTIG